MYVGTKISEGKNKNGTISENAMQEETVFFEEDCGYDVYRIFNGARSL